MPQIELLCCRHRNRPANYRVAWAIAMLLTVAINLNSNPVRAADEAPPDFAQAGTAFLKKNCLECHSGKEPEAGISLEALASSQAIVEQRKLAQTVMRVISAGEMPPEDKPRPTLADSEAFVEQIRATLAWHDRHAPPDPGRVTMRRLNRVEYANSVRDLIGIDFNPAEDFPSDDIGHGFDNIGDVLTVSPVLMERYLDAAETIMAKAIAPVPLEPQHRHFAAIYTEPASADVIPKLTDLGYRRMVSNGQYPTEVGPIFTSLNSKFEDDGEYIARVKLYAQSGDNHPVKAAILVRGKSEVLSGSSEAELARLVGKIPQPAQIVHEFEVKVNSRDQAEIIEVRLPAQPGRTHVAVGMLKAPDGAAPQKMWVEHFQLTGPLDSRPRPQKHLLAVTAGKSQSEQTREVLSRFLRRAFRRPATDDDLNRYGQLVEQAIAQGDTWEGGMQFVMQAALCSPKFLFRAELDDQPTSPEARPIDQFHLASRLSYFLWSTMPDDELLDLAEQGKLTENLDAQVRRMLADARSKSLVEQFAMQWLQLQRLDFISPDGGLFPTFSNKLRAAMLQETAMFVESIIREDRSVLELIDADYTFLNESLAKHYGIADTKGNWIGKPVTVEGGQPIKGEQFQRVSLQGGVRGGLLTQASVLTASSNPTRTSPVKRGRWVLEQILGTPPPPPPPNVPELDGENKQQATGTLRERMAAHMQNPSCANCHAKMDPIGFALENFNAVGMFREKDGEFEIDPSGEFPDGTKFAGPAELKQVIKSRKDEFLRSLIDKLLTYGLGRGTQYYDQPTIEKIAQATQAGDYKFAVLISEIVKSDPFTKRRGITPAN
jgi:mono/diheme cytochrome c family protein